MNMPGHNANLQQAPCTKKHSHKTAKVTIIWRIQRNFTTSTLRPSLQLGVRRTKSPHIPERRLLRGRNPPRKPDQRRKHPRVLEYTRHLRIGRPRHSFLQSLVDIVIPRAWLFDACFAELPSNLFLHIVSKLLIFAKGVRPRGEEGSSGSADAFVGGGGVGPGGALAFDGAVRAKLAAAAL